MSMPFGAKYVYVNVVKKSRTDNVFAESLDILALNGLNNALFQII